MYRKILAPVDGSAAATRGLREAIRLAKGQRARLRILHVVDEAAALGAAETGIDVDAMMRELTKVGRAVLERSARMARKSGIRAETALLESAAGSAADHILRDATDWGAELIVMGTHGRRGLRRLVLGSDAEQIVRQSGVPVLLVRAATG